MNKYHKSWRNWKIFVLISAVWLSALSTIKGFIINWDIFALKEQNLYVSIGYLASIFLFYMYFVYFRKYDNLMKEEFDERFIKILNNSIRNGGIMALLMLMFGLGTASLFYGLYEPIFSINDTRLVFIPIFVVIVISYVYYNRSKGL